MSPSLPYDQYDPCSGTREEPVDPLDFAPGLAYGQPVPSYRNSRPTAWDSSLDSSMLPIPHNPNTGYSLPDEIGRSRYSIPDLDHGLDVGQHPWNESLSSSTRQFPGPQNVGPYVDLDRPGPSTLPPPIGFPPSAFTSSGTYDIAQSFGKIFISDSALDAEGDDAENPEELAPPPPRSPQRRYSPYGLDRPKRVSSPVKPTSSSAQSSSSSVRTSGRSRPRNTQSDVLPEAFEQALLDSSCVCPACGFVPASRRAPDLRRHMNTHRGRASHEKWVCCGVPLEKADEYGIEDTSDSYMYKGHEMIGGCLQGFSRRDALIRHLKNDRIECYGIVDLAEKMSEL